MLITFFFVLVFFKLSISLLFIFKAPLDEELIFFLFEHVLLIIILRFFLLLLLLYCIFLCELFIPLIFIKLLFIFPLGSIIQILLISSSKYSSFTCSEKLLLVLSWELYNKLIFLIFFS